ncbi:hypothetical protein HDU79_007082 [Rhizoclosmatium sp. JEL0117]|nr:hypothetical protein HDU79_007082 [Rhizoclosmatium sp. JEL0117]
MRAIQTRAGVEKARTIQKKKTAPSSHLPPELWDNMSCKDRHVWSSINRVHPLVIASRRAKRHERADVKSEIDDFYRISAEFPTLAPDEIADIQIKRELARRLNAAENKWKDLEELSTGQVDDMGICREIGENVQQTQ